MLKRFALPALLAGIVATGVVAEVLPTSPAGAGDASTGESAAVAKVAARKSLTAKAVRAARAFKASLSSSQRAAVQYSFSSSEKRSGWSNLPTNFVPRNGVAIKDLGGKQRARLRTLLDTILSSQGYADEVAVIKANAYLRQEQRNGSGTAPIVDYGTGLYYVAFFGTPSASKKWTVQFGGHHYALHMTFSGATVSNTPHFIGVDPPTAFEVEGQTYQPMADEVAALFGAVRSLNASQRARARLSQSFDDVLVGPQRDGQFPGKRGVTVSTLSARQQSLVTRAIRSYVGDMPRKQANRHIAKYERQYSKTKLAWSGSTDATVPGAYVRIHGPRVWLELAMQKGIGPFRSHYHSIERDIERDYGAGP
jgi:Protein of unknown function (DUF3500)